jgi:GR25 family glycosyltransferase involved in LPS biosynthesis
MKKIVINLERRKDRKELFEKNNSFLTDVSFLQAFDGKQLTHEKLKKIGFDTNKLWRDPFKNRKITKGEVGCFISHFNAWKLCAQMNEPVIILEDDAVINKELWDEEYYAEVINNNCGLLYLQRNENEPEKVLPIDDKLEVPAYPYNMTAYVIRPEVARMYINSGINKTIVPVDEFVPLTIKQAKIKALKKDAANQISRSQSHSDIEPSSEGETFVDFNVHTITVGTDRKKSTTLYDTALEYGIYPKNLGTNVEWKGTDMSGPGGGMKLNLVKNFIKDLPDNDLVLFTDAYDVFYADDLETITNRFLGFNTKCLFAAEADCWPDQQLASSFPRSETKYRYLNSGLFMAQVSELKRLLAEDIRDDEDDQLFIQKKFLSGEYDMKMDYESYIFQCHDWKVQKRGKQLYNPETGCFSCLYHGNGGADAKQKFLQLSKEFNKSYPTLFIPNYKKFDVMDKDMLVVDFMTQTQCEDMIAIADAHGGWGSLSYDKFPAQEIRLKELGIWEEMKAHWEKHLYPVIEEYWWPIQMYGMRDAFVMRYSMDTQTSLAMHHDASLVTGSVKLNDDYVGADLVFPRQNFSNKDVPVGRCILFPGQVTHGHTCEELLSGVKYSLTMWSCRYPGEVGG